MRSANLPVTRAAARKILTERTDRPAKSCPARVLRIVTKRAKRRQHTTPQRPFLRDLAAGGLEALRQLAVAVGQKPI